MNFPNLSFAINSPSNNVLKMSLLIVFAPVNITCIFVLIKYILPLLVINKRVRSPSALSVTTKLFLIFGIFELSSISAILDICKVNEDGPIKSLG